MRKIIAIVGKIGVGKDEAAKYLSTKLNWPIFQISSPLKDEVKKRGLELNRENIQKIGVEFAQKYGDDYIARLALESCDENMIVSGPRQLGQISFFKKNTQFVMINITAKDHLRFERVKNRNSVNEAGTLEEFVKDEIEKDSSGPVQRVEDCIKLADYSVDNDSTLEKLFKKLDEILEKEGISV